MTRKSVKQMEKTIAKQAKVNPKKFWQYVKSKMTSRSGIPNITIPGTENDPGGPKLTSSFKEQVEIFSAYFASVFTKSPNAHQSAEDHQLEHILEPLFITPTRVSKRLKALNTSKSPGPDNIHPQVLKELGNELAEPLSILFNNSLGCVALPVDWKSGNICYIQKRTLAITDLSVLPV